MARIRERIARLEMQREAIITPPENETPYQQYLRLINEPCAAPSKTRNTASYTPEEAYQMMIGGKA
jgi:hypothetical protein